MAPPRKKPEDRELTDQQELFVEEFLRSGNGRGAASYAGFAHPDRAYLKLMSKPHVAKAIRDGLAAKALNMTPQMLEVLAGIALDEENVQARDRIAAAVAVVDRAGMANGKGGANVQVNNTQVNVGPSAAEVQRLIAETFNRGGGGQTMIPQEGGAMQMIELQPIHREIIEPKQ